MDDGIPVDNEILVLQKEGHTFHCAMRILCGDGECECNKKDFIPGFISRRMYKGRCPVCLQLKKHKPWCRNAKEPTEIQRTQKRRAADLYRYLLTIKRKY